MKVLATKGSGKTPVVYAGVASTVAFMGPKRRWPPMFYFSSMMAADAEALATDSSLSAHPVSRLPHGRVSWRRLNVARRRVQPGVQRVAPLTLTKDTASFFH